MAGVSCGIALWAQRQGGAVISLGYLPVASRIENMAVAYVRYIEKTFWPAHLAVFYPMPDRWMDWQIAGAGTILALVTGWVVWRARAQRYLVTGWLWFLGMLAPVIGLVQIGSQSMADRYDYLASVGLFIMAIWAAGEWVPRFGARAPAILGGLAVAVCMVATPLQVRYWKNSAALFAHAAATTQNNPIIEDYLGSALGAEGRTEEAMAHLRRALTLAPGFAQAHYDLGNLLLRLGRAGEAIPHFQETVQVRPNSAEAHRQLGNALRQAGRMAEAVGQYEKALAIRPDDIQASGTLAWVLATCPDSSLRNGAMALALALRADRLSGGQDPVVLGTLAAAYAEVGNFSEAIPIVQRALSLAAAESNSALAGALQGQLALYRAGSPFREAEPSPAPSSP
jgi:tetratricopeptide (TPR) repeat protein